MAKRDDHDHDIDADDQEAEVAEVADDQDDYEDADEAAEAEEPYEEEKPRLKPKVTALTLVLCFLNVLAAVGFLFLLMLNYEKRQAYTFASTVEEVKLAGLGTKEDTVGPTAGLEALPRPKLNNEALKEAFKTRGGTTSTQEPFTPVEDGFRYQLYSGELSPAIVKELLSDLGEPVGSIEEELGRIKNKLFPAIEAVAKQAVAQAKGGDAAKQKEISKLLYPLCLNPMQVEKLEKKIKATQGPALNQLLEDAVERRILADILWPVEMFRPGAPDKAILERVADVDGVKLAEVRDLMTRRLDAAAKDSHDGSVHYGSEWDGQKRWTVEKRQNAALLLVSLAYARTHLGAAKQFEDGLLDPKQLERTQRISGLYDFTLACSAYNDAVQRLTQRVLDAIALDRDGFHIEKNNVVKRSAGFPDKHAALIVSIRYVQLQIEQAKERLKDLEQQRDRGQKLVKERGAHEDEVKKRIVQERETTKKLVEQLREIQQQLFRANVQLADAVEINAALLERINRMSGLKGSNP